jgi:hypothetical protein
MRRALVITLGILGLLAPAGALASGGPAPPIMGGAGVSVAGNPFNYVTLATGSSTLVERVRRGAGTVEASNLIAGAFGVPGAAYDGSGTGLSANGRTLVLAGIINNYPPTRTRLVVLDAGGLRVRARITLRGYFTVDAISPTGRWLYLIDYSSQTNLTDYQVRAYDLTHRRLLAKPIVDPRQPDEKMVGVPMTRVMSPGGRWAYTLYQSFNGAPFIHALDTAARRAFCVDLPTLTNLDFSSVTLALSGATLRIEQNGSPLALLNTRTFAVGSPSAPQPPSPRRAATAAVSPDSNGLLASAIGLAAAAMLALFLFARRRRRT